MCRTFLDQQQELPGQKVDPNIFSHDQNGEMSFLDFQFCKQTTDKYLSKVF